MEQSEYIRNSLELHLFFDRIMKEHSFFLEASFMEKDKELKKIANDFQKIFSDILKNTIFLAEGNVSENFLTIEEIVTKKTLDAERLTSNLSGINIDFNITNQEHNLKKGNIVVSEQLLDSISNLNRQTLPIIQNLISFKNDILNNVLNCNLYTTNYPLLIVHIMNEAKMYHELLSKVEAREAISKNYLYEQELFWNNIMKEHAEFITGLLDPSEKDLIKKSSNFAKEYEIIISTYKNYPVFLQNESLKETMRFRDFKIASEEGILNCKIKSIIIPLLADHVLREANHFIRILQNVNYS